MSNPNRNRVFAHNLVWDVDTLAWTEMTQPGGGVGGGGDASAAHQLTEIDKLTILADSVDAQSEVHVYNQGLDLLAATIDSNAAVRVDISSVGGLAGAIGAANPIPVQLSDGAAVYKGALETTAAAINTNTTRLKMLVASGTASSSGNNSVLTPTSGKKLRVFYLSYSPLTAITCAYRFGASGTLFFKNPVPAGGIVAKDFGDLRYVEGAVDEELFLNLSSGLDTVWNCFYVEI